MIDSPFAFRQNTKQLVKNSTKFDFPSANFFIWDPDSKQVIARFEEEGGPLSNLIVDIEKTDQEPRDITASLVATLRSWQQQIELRAQSLSLLAPDEVKNATSEAVLNQPSPSPSPRGQRQKPAISNSSSLSGSTELTAEVLRAEGQQPATLNYYPNGLVFSPDEDKILYQNKEGRYKVYDLKAKKEYTLPEFTDFVTISWYPDSEHLVVAQKDLISIIEADGINKVTVYSGKFENGFVFAHPSGTRLVILTTLTQTEGTPANLYSINLR